MEEVLPLSLLHLTSASGSKEEELLISFSMLTLRSLSKKHLVVCLLLNSEIIHCSEFVTVGPN